MKSAALGQALNYHSPAANQYQVSNIEKRFVSGKTARLVLVSVLRWFPDAIRAAAIGLLLGCILMLEMDLLPAGQKPHHVYVGGQMHDYIPYYAASRLILAGQGDRMYDFPALHHVELELHQPLGTDNGVLPYLYPPYFALALTPLATLPFDMAARLWLLISCLLLSIVTLALQRYARLSRRGCLLLWLSVWCWIPVFITLRVGQVAVLVLSLLTLSFFALKSGHPGVGGVALACAMLKPPLILPLLLVLLLYRRWAVLASWATSALVLVAAPTALLGFHVDRAYLAALHEASTWTTQFGYAPQGNESFAGFTQMLFLQPEAMVAQVVLSIAALALLVTATRSVPFDVSFAIAIPVGLLICPHVGMYDLCLLLVPLAVMLRHRETIPVHPRLLLAVGLVVVPSSFVLTWIAPLQLSVLVMSLLVLRLSSYRGTRLGEHSTSRVPALRTEIDHQRHLCAGSKGDAALSAPARHSW